MYIFHIFLIHSSVVGHQGCFLSLPIVNIVAMNIGIQKSLWYLLGRCPGVVFYGSYCSSVFSFLRKLHSAFHNCCANLHSHQQCIRVPALWHPCQHLLLPLIMVILTGMRWNLTVILIWISFITRKGEHFFMYLLAICTSSFYNSLFNPCAHFFHWNVHSLGVEFFLIPCGFWILVPHWMNGW
jgi:hypothetical protein